MRVVREKISPDPRNLTQQHGSTFFITAKGPKKAYLRKPNSIAYPCPQVRNSKERNDVRNQRLIYRNGQGRISKDRISVN